MHTGLEWIALGLEIHLGIWKNTFHHFNNYITIWRKTFNNFLQIYVQLSAGYAGLEWAALGLEIHLLGLIF